MVQKLQSEQTDRQTDGQTDRQTDSSENITYPHMQMVITWDFGFGKEAPRPTPQ